MWLSVQLFQLAFTVSWVVCQDNYWEKYQPEYYEPTTHVANLNRDIQQYGRNPPGNFAKIEFPPFRGSHISIKSDFLITTTEATKQAHKQKDLPNTIRSSANLKNKESHIHFYGAETNSKLNRLSSLKSQPEGSPQASQPIPKISEAPSILQRFSPKESLQPKSPPRDQTHTQSSVYIAKVEQYGNQLSSAQSRQTLVRQIEKSGISETTGRPRLQQSERDQYGNIAAVVTAQPDKEQEYSQPSEPQKSSDITPSYYGSQQQQSSASKYNPPIIQPISLNRTEHTNGQVNPQQPRKEVNYGQYGNIPEVIPEEPGNQQTSSDSEMAQTQKPLQYLQYGQQKQAIPEPANSKQISLKPTDEVSNSDISEANPVIPPRSYSEYNQQKQDRFEPEKKQLRPNESPKLPSPIESQMFSNSNVQPESITPETTTTVPIDIYSTFERQYRRPVTRPSKTSEPLWYSRSPPVYLSTPPQYGHQPEEFRSTSGTRRLVIYPTVKFSLPPAYPSYRFANELYNAEYANPAPRRQVIVGYYHFQDSNPFIKRKK